MSKNIKSGINGIKSTNTDRSEGVQRLIFISSILLSGGWLLYALIEGAFSNFDLEVGLIVISGTAIGYFLPILLGKIAYWIKDGFEKDKKE